jgi:hypothetical protein
LIADLYFLSPTVRAATTDGWLRKSDPMESSLGGSVIEHPHDSFNPGIAYDSAVGFCPKAAAWRGDFIPM